MAIGALVAAASLTILMIWDKSGIFTDSGGFAFNEAGLVDSGSGNHVSGSLVYRDAFAGKGSFVNGTGSLQDHTVYRNIFAGTYYKDVSFVTPVRWELWFPHRSFRVTAVLGASFIRFFRASVVLPLERASSILPTVISVRIMAADSK